MCPRLLPPTAAGARGNVDTCCDKQSLLVKSSQVIVNSKRVAWTAVFFLPTPPKSALLLGVWAAGREEPRAHGVPPPQPQMFHAVCFEEARWFCGSPVLCRMGDNRMGVMCCLGWRQLRGSGVLVVQNE